MNRYRILCVDDDIMMLNTLEDILTEEGFDVSLAKSGRQALHLLETGIQIDLILLDIDMPEMDGYETFQGISEMEAYANTPIIFLTGMDSPDLEVKGLEIGASDYISKPFVKNVLIARIRGQLRKSAKSAKSSDSPSDKDSKYNPEALKLLEKTLNDSEQIIARHIADGLTNQEIAEQTNYSYNYVKKMCSSILSKLGLSRRSEIRKMLKNSCKNNL